MTADDQPAPDQLSAPLGRGKRARSLLDKWRFKLPVTPGQAIAGLLAACVATFAAWVVLVDEPFGGEPMAVVSADLRPPPQVKKPGDTPPAKAQPDPATPPGTAPAPDKKAGNTVTIIDGATGKRQEVVVGQAPDKPGEPAPGDIDPRLVETTRHGPVPRIAPDGTRPADVYAHPMNAAPKPNSPRIALIVGGVGIGANVTAESFAKLPSTVTFAFAAHGADVARWVTRARSEKREFLLQVAMEPHDYPDNDPGPQTLLTSLAPDQNVDRLHWFMSRIQGYVGITNAMGARFTATDQSLAPVLREVAKRGLIYFDDGSLPRSLASQIAGANGVAFAKADIVLDAVPTPGEIDNALNRLEAMARDRGTAIGMTTALPATIDRIRNWIKQAEGRGIVLVPLSAVANKPKSGS